MKFLKSTIKAEPIIWNWYAWSYLIPPATAACNIVGRHLKIMNSYLLAPQAHVQAVNNPKLLGGPFIDLNGEKLEEIAALIDKTKADCSALIEFENGLKESDNIIKNEALGGSLSDFYNRLPDSVGGLVELVYDLNNNPSLRLIEPLIYNKYYSNSFQAIDLSETFTDFRPFALSTPCLEDENKIRLGVPFEDTRLDILFSTKSKPRKLSELIDIFDIAPSKQKQFSSLFTDTPPEFSKDRNFNQEGGVRVRYLGHACILLETKDLSILIDPVISYPVQSPMQRYTFNDLPDHLDYLVITHNHQDHVMLETLLALRHKTSNIVFPRNQKGALADPSLKLILSKLGFKSLIELDEMETLPIKNGSITGLPFFGEHSDLNIQTKLAYNINLHSKNFLFVADSNNLDGRLYKYIFKEIGEIDFLFIGMECEGAPLTWLYGPLLSSPIKRSFDYSRTLSGSDFQKAWSLLEFAKAKHAYVYAMGQEPWLNYVMALKYEKQSPQIRESDKFVAACRQNGIEAERLYGRKEWII